MYTSNQRNRYSSERQIQSRSKSIVCGTLSLEAMLALVIMTILALGIGRYQAQIKATRYESLKRLQALQKVNSSLEQLLLGTTHETECEVMKNRRELVFLMESGKVFAKEQAWEVTVKKKYHASRGGTVEITTMLPVKDFPIHTEIK